MPSADRPTVYRERPPLPARAVDLLLRPVRRLGGLQLTPEALSAAADRGAGPDLAPDQVAEPLALLCQDLAEHPPTALGAALLRSSILQGLVSRRRLQRAPGPPTPRQPPVVIVGWYRTGTTLLQQLLDAIPGMGFAPLHRLLTPVKERWSRPRTALGTTAGALLSPELPILHPVTAAGPEECWTILMSHLVVDGMAFHWTLPRFQAWLARVDRLPAYRTWARALALLEADLGHRLVLKDPAHLAALPALVQALPQARLVWTHRDPAACIASFASLTAVQHRAATGRLDRERAGRVTLEQAVRSLELGHRARSQLPAGQLLDLDFEVLMADPVAATEQVCRAFDLPFDADAVAGRAARQARSRPKHVTSLELWGLDEDRVRERLGELR